jgi:glutamine synthetase
MNKVPKGPEDCPLWNFDGSSTGQAEGDDSEIILRPVKVVPDPFRKSPNVLVLCECENPDGSPAVWNTRRAAKNVFDKDPDAAPWYGLEQEYTLFENDGRTPYGWPKGGFPGPQGPYYCGAGTGKAFGRHVVEAHYSACLYAGLEISGINAEVMAGQWEYQVGPCEGIDCGDQMILSRYILERVTEEFDVCVSLDPKPIPGDWNGAGCHVNYSTRPMRQDGGYDVILNAMKKLEAKHEEHIRVYGSGNERRLTGEHETASIEKFSYGVADRGASIRIPRFTEKGGKGYLEDRRPASNIDPYAVSSKIFQTTHLE